MIEELEEVSPEKVKELEDHLRSKLDVARRRLIEDAERAHEIRKIQLC